MGARAPAARARVLARLDVHRRLHFLPQRNAAAGDVTSGGGPAVIVDPAGRPEDTIVRFEAVELWQDSPPPGQTEPTNIRKRRFLQWP